MENCSCLRIDVLDKLDKELADLRRRDRQLLKSFIDVRAQIYQQNLQLRQKTNNLERRYTLMPAEVTDMLQRISADKQTDLNGGMTTIDESNEQELDDTTSNISETGHITEASLTSIPSHIVTNDQIAAPNQIAIPDEVATPDQIATSDVREEAAQDYLQDKTKSDYLETRLNTMVSLKIGDQIASVPVRRANKLHREITYGSCGRTDGDYRYTVPNANLKQLSPLSVKIENEIGEQSDILKEKDSLFVTYDDLSLGNPRWSRIRDELLSPGNSSPSSPQQRANRVIDVDKLIGQELSN